MQYYYIITLNIRYTYKWIYIYTHTQTQKCMFMYLCIWDTKERECKYRIKICRYSDFLKKILSIWQEEGDHK